VAEKRATYEVRPAWRAVSKKEAPAVLENLRREMKEAARRLEFERAAQLRDIIFELEESTGLTAARRRRRAH